MAAPPPARPGQPLELALQPWVGEHLARAAPLASANRQPRGRPGARAVVVPPRRRRRRRGPDGQPGHPDAAAGGHKQRAFATRHAMALQPPSAFQSSRVRTSHAQAPAHRRPPCLHRCRPNPHEPRKSSHRRRAREQLSHRWSPSVSFYSTDPDSPRLPESHHRPVPAPGPSRVPSRSSAAEADYLHTWWGGSPPRLPTTAGGKNPMNAGAGAGRGQASTRFFRVLVLTVLSHLLKLLAIIDDSQRIAIAG